MAGMIFETKERSEQDYDTLRFFKFIAKAEGEKRILEAFLSPFLRDKNKYYPVWEMMSVDDVVLTAQAIIPMEDITRMERETLEIEKPKVIADELGITTVIVSGNTEKAMGRPMKIEELRRAIYKHHLIKTIEGAVTDLPVMRDKLQKIYTFERAEKMANAGIAV